MKESGTYSCGPRVIVTPRVPNSQLSYYCFVGGGVGLPPTQFMGPAKSCLNVTLIKKFEPKSKVNWPEKCVFLGLLNRHYPTRSYTRTDWQAKMKKLNQSCNRHITVNRDYLNLIMTDPAISDPNHARSRIQSG